MQCRCFRYRINFPAMFSVDTTFACKRKQVHEALRPHNDAMYAGAYALMQISVILLIHTDV